MSENTLSEQKINPMDSLFESLQEKPTTSQNPFDVLSSVLSVDDKASKEFKCVDTSQRIRFIAYYKKEGEYEQFIDENLLPLVYEINNDLDKLAVLGITNSLVKFDNNYGRAISNFMCKVPQKAIGENLISAKIGALCLVNLKKFLIDDGYADIAGVFDKWAAITNNDGKKLIVSVDWVQK